MDIFNLLSSIFNILQPKKLKKRILLAIISHILNRKFTSFNCDVTNFKNGVRVTGEGNALVSNIFCGNDRDMLGEGTNIGIFNTCNGGNWADENDERCTFDCDGDMRDKSEDLT